VEFGLLGPLLVRDGGTRLIVSAPRQRVLLAALLLKAGHVVSADEIGEALWDGRPPGGARGALHSGVQRLRATLGPAGPGLILTRPPGYLIEIGDGELDLHRFGRLASTGRTAAAAGQWEQAADALREALALWRGEPLADVPSPVLQARETPSLAEQHLHVLASRIEADLHLGRHGELVPELRQLVLAQPLRERFHAQLMAAYYLAGRQADALAAYQHVWRVLDAELGVEPGPELKRLHTQILNADPGLIPAASRRPAPGPAAAGRHGGPAEAGSGPAAAGYAGGAAPSRRQGPAQLPAAIRHFTGRAGELAALGELLASPGMAGGFGAAGGSGTAAPGQAAGPVVISAIDGPPGIGKTALAIHFAHQVAHRFPDGQLYLNLRGFDPSGTPVPPTAALRGFLDAFAVEPPQIPASLDAQAALYRSLLAGKRVLVVLDNARDAEQVRPLLPGSPTCLVIVTSRRQLTSLVASEGAHRLALDLLSAGEAQQMLGRLLGPDRTLADPAATAELIEVCARLPLALSIAAARVAARPSFALATLVGQLKDADARLDRLDAGDAMTNVRTVFSWSCQQLTAPGRRMFALLGLHPGPDISASAAASLAGASQAEAWQALGELNRAHLVAEHAPGRFMFHDLLRAYAAEQAAACDSEAERRAAVHRMLDHYLHTAHAAALLVDPTRHPIELAAPQPGVTPEPLADAGQAVAWFEAECQVLLAVTSQAGAAGFDVHGWQLPWAMARFLDTQSHWREWVMAARDALAAAERLGDHAALADAHHRLGCALDRVRSAEQAEAHLEHAVFLYHELGEATGEANARISLAAACGEQGRNADALSHSRQALALAQAADNRAYQALALNTVGWYEAMLGDYKQALSHCRQALALHREYGNRHGESNAWDSLGYAHLQMGEHAAAAACYQQALDLRFELGEHLARAKALISLGDVRDAGGSPAGARDAWQSALDILSALHHPDAAGARARLHRMGATTPISATRPA
jgi:DNA-binding SARP family transcriptional activator